MISKIPQLNFENIDQKNTAILHKPKLIILAGLPGTGKTTLARFLSKKLSLVYLRLDCIEVPFCVYSQNAGANGEGYHAIANIAKENLNLGLGVIIDTVNPLHITRTMFLSLAKEIEVEIFQFELKMNDEILHRKRVEKRKADIAGHNIPTWQDVLNLNYEKWNADIDGYTTVLCMDNSKQAFHVCLNTIYGK